MSIQQLSPIKIILTACGCPGASTLIKRLKGNGERKVTIIGTDMNKEAIGRFLCDGFYEVPNGTSDEFIPAMMAIVEKEKPTLIFPESSNEVLSLAKAREKFEAIRVGLRYSEVTDNIRRLVAARNRRGLTRPVVKLNFVLREDNRHEKGPFIREWKGIVDRICFDDEHNWSRGGVESGGREVLHACLRIWNTFTVLWDGRVALCCLDYDGEEILGDLTSQTIRDVWHSPRLSRIRQMHSQRDFSSIALCRACSKIR